METIQTRIVDLGQTVTSKWLSTKLDLPGSEAEALLSQFYEDIQRGKRSGVEKNDLELVYMVSGRNKDSTVFSTILLTKSKLENEQQMKQDYGVLEILHKVPYAIILKNNSASRTSVCDMIWQTDHEITRAKISKLAINQKELSPHSSVAVSQTAFSKRIAPVKTVNIQKAADLKISGESTSAPKKQASKATSSKRSKVIDSDDDEMEVDVPTSVTDSTKPEPALIPTSNPEPTSIPKTKKPETKSKSKTVASGRITSFFRKSKT